jgi:hypothetical protein
VVWGGLAVPRTVGAELGLAVVADGGAYYARERAPVRDCREKCVNFVLIVVIMIITMVIIRIILVIIAVIRMW